MSELLVVLPDVAVLEPVGWFHRLHRSARRIDGSLAHSA
jgi:hypothetical protein